MALLLWRRQALLAYTWLVVVRPWAKPCPQKPSGMKDASTTDADDCGEWMMVVLFSFLMMTTKMMVVLMTMLMIGTENCWCWFQQTL